MQCLIIREITTLAVGDRHSEQSSFCTPMGERRIRDFFAYRHHLADKTKRSIADERTRQKAGCTQNLETVACAKHEYPRALIADHSLHDRRESCSRVARMKM